MSDKTSHFAAYAVLSLLLVRALCRGRLSAATWSNVALAVVLSSLYGVTDEFHQRFVPGRSPDVMDVFADALGALTAGMGALALAQVRRTGRYTS